MPIQFVSHRDINPLKLPPDIIVIEDQATLRQLAELAGVGAPLRESPPPGAKVGAVLILTFPSGTHHGMIARNWRGGDPKDDILCGVFVPKSLPDDAKSEIFDLFQREAAGDRVGQEVRHVPVSSVESQ